MTYGKLISKLKLTKSYKDLTYSLTKDVLLVIFKIMVRELNYYNQLKLQDFGTFTIKKYNTKNHGVFHTIKFKPAKSLIAKIN